MKKHQDIITDPELSKRLMAAGICRTPVMGFWYELHRIYNDNEQQKLAREKKKDLRWEFNLPEKMVNIYESTKFADEIGTYRLELENRIPAYTLDELMDHLPARVLIDDEYIRHVEIKGDNITIYYKSKTTSFRLGETVEDTDLTVAVGKMIVSLNLQGCMN